MKIFIKIIAAIFLFAICALTFYTGRVPFVEGYNPIFPDINTRFSDNYDKDKFEQIAPGNDTTAVIGKIGYPISIYQNSDNTVYWSYSTSGACEQWNFAWLIRTVLIDTTGKVVETVKAIAYD